MTLYSAAVMDDYNHPRHAGVIAAAGGIDEVGNFLCGTPFYKGQLGFEKGF